MQEHIDRIYNKVQARLKQISLLEKENLQLKQHLTDLKSQKETCDAQIQELQQQNYILKAATNKMNDSDKAALELSINKYIRDIDKCIGLLSE